MQVVTDEQWSTLAPLLDAVRPRAPQPIRWFRRTIEAIVWRLQNGAKWRAIPTVLGPWWMAAQTFIRWSRLGVWERLLRLAQERGIGLGMTFLDGTSIRAHSKAAGAAKKARQRKSGTSVRRLVALVAASGRRPARKLSTAEARAWRAVSPLCAMPLCLAALELRSTSVNSLRPARRISKLRSDLRDEVLEASCG